MTQSCCWVCVLLSEDHTLKMVKAVYPLLTKQAQKHWKLFLDCLATEQWLAKNKKEKYETYRLSENKWPKQSTQQR